MAKESDAPVLLCGRYFTPRELQEIQETVRMFPKLSRHELVMTVCENLDWTTPIGQYKLASCGQLLNKLEAQGLVRLPAKRGDRTRNTGERITPGPRTDELPVMEGNAADLEPINLEPVRSQERIRLWNEYVHRYHALGYKRPFGAHQRYFILSGMKPDQPLGCLLFSAAAWALAVRDEWIGWTRADRSRRLNLVLNNTRFLIFPWVRVRNLASKALSVAAKRVRFDWQARYGYSPVLLETFVDPENYRGTSYQAANWILLGQTVGRGRMDRYKEYLLTPKLIYAYPLVADFRAYLCREGRADE